MRIKFDTEHTILWFRNDLGPTMINCHCQKTNSRLLESHLSDFDDICALALVGLSVMKEQQATQKRIAALIGKKEL